MSLARVAKLIVEETWPLLGRRDTAQLVGRTNRLSLVFGSY